MKEFVSESQITGEFGEDLVCKYLENKGFDIVERNFTQKWGEIDIVAEKQGIVHFIEVKSVSRENFDTISHETDEFRPEDQMHGWKQKRLMRTIEVYLIRNPAEEWQFDLACIYLDFTKRLARIKMIEDIILGSR